ncbi:hypothetical protein [Clostridium sp. DL1XJH146]
MKQFKISKLITTFIGFGLAFYVADKITNYFDIVYNDFLSLNYLIYLLISVTTLVTFEFIFSKIRDKYRKIKDSKQQKK